MNSHLRNIGLAATAALTIAGASIATSDAALAQHRGGGVAQAGARVGLARVVNRTVNRTVVVNRNWRGGGGGWGPGFVGGLALGAVASPYYYGGYYGPGPYAYDPYVESAPATYAYAAPYAYRSRCYMQRRVVVNHAGHRMVRRVRVCG